ncbi:Cruciform DNA binding protein [Vermiconidia calcicola]|uniref:Cruciform DNA binding protein n=1 Tax=Vermiconidia calcicola TaxID=1690605 RepID=A0ACC3MCW5_9PEZI|nr:Cruciform DNA binding protein [Vermiconidia calcicola]
MGSYTFRWDQPAEEVFVTGTFDNWSKSVKLDKKDTVHEKTIAVPASEKILYKFVVDGKWQNDPTTRSETDQGGYVNNVLFPADIKPPMSAAEHISSVGPGATTTELAGGQPKEESAPTPGAFPEDPAADDQTEMASEQPKEDKSPTPGAFPETPAADDDQTFSVNPTPASGGASNPVQLAPGEKVPDSSTMNDNTVTSGVHDDPELKSKDGEGEQSFGVSPIPASEGAGNPVQLAPGEKVPDSSTMNDNTLTSGVHDDPELKSKDQEGEQSFGVSPIPATGGISNPVQLPPGDKVPDSSTMSDNTITSGVHDDPELKTKDQESEQTLGVSPIPATGGIGNPVHLEPGEKVPDPSTMTSNTIDSNVKTDKESYERSDAYPPTSPAGAGTLQERVTPSSAILSGPGPIIPESSMPMGNNTDLSEENIGPTMSSVSPESTTNKLAGQQPKEARGVPEVVSESQQSTTNELAGQQPKEPRGVPEVVSESQQEAHADPEASADPEAVDQKKAMEDELQKTISQEPVTSESGALGRSENGVGASAAAGIAAAGAAAAGGAVAANYMKDKAETDPQPNLPESVQNTVDEKPKGLSSMWQPAHSGDVAASEPVSTVPDVVASEPVSTVPDVVKESQMQAGEPPEAAASSEAVKEKSEMETSLLKQVPESDATGEPAPTEGATAATIIPAATASSSGAPQLGDPTAGVAPISLDDKPGDPTAGVAPISMDATPADSGLNAPKESDAMAPTEKAAVEETPLEPPPVAESKPVETPPAAESKPMDSRDVSPMSKPVGGSQQSQPLVTTGVASSATPRENRPSTNTEKRHSFMDTLRGTPSSTKSTHTTDTTDSKKEKRRSFFGKLKDKLKS